MARPKGTDNNARNRLIAAAGRGFKAGGFGGIGVDALAKEAGLTSGAFYAHLGSKAGAFDLAVGDGLCFLRNGISEFQVRHGAAWRDFFVDFYLGDRMNVELSEACALPTLSADVSRARVATRKLYETELQAIIELIAHGPGSSMSIEKAWSFLSILNGAAIMARAVSDKKIRAAILNSAAKTAKSI